MYGWLASEAVTLQLTLSVPEAESVEHRKGSARSRSRFFRTGNIGGESIAVNVIIPLAIDEGVSVVGVVGISRQRIDHRVARRHFDGTRPFFLRRRPK